MDSKNKVSTEDNELVETSSWMIRPCLVYDLEYSQCTSLKGRFYQYYLNGKTEDCNKWDPLRKACRKWERDIDIKAGVTIIKHEKQTVARRLESRKNNDVWNVRQNKPPENWNSPLPEHLVEKNQGSYLEQHMEELYNQSFKPKKSTSFCTIS